MRVMRTTNILGGRIGFGIILAHWKDVAWMDLQACSPHTALFVTFRLLWPQSVWCM